MADIFYQGRVYLNVHQVKRLFPVTEHTKIGTCLYLENFESHPVHGSHNFKDGQEVVLGEDYDTHIQYFFFGDWSSSMCGPDGEIQSYIDSGQKTRTAAIAIPTPPDKVEGGKKGVDGEAKALVVKFYDAASVQDFNEIRGWYTNVEESNKQAKQCALIHCDLMISKLSELPNTGLHNDFGIMDERKHYTDLKAAINKL